MTHTVSVLNDEFRLPHSQATANNQEFSKLNCEMCGLPGEIYGNGLYNDHAFRILSCHSCALIWTDPLLDQPKTLNGEGE